MKIVVLSIAGSLLATVSWLVAGHAVGSAQSTIEPLPVVLSVPQRNDDDEDEFFDGGSAVFDGGTNQPVMHSSGS